jgi:phosphoribosylaminoimidazole-succinocarboxamide synthase
MPCCSDWEPEMTVNTAISMTENVFIPLKIVKRGGLRGRFLSKTYSAEKNEVDKTLVKGLLKAHLWEKLIYEQFDGDIDLFCIKNKLSKGYVQQILRLNLLSPRIKEAILGGNHPKHLVLRNLVRKPLPASWIEQEKMLGFEEIK